VLPSATITAPGGKAVNSVGFSSAGMLATGCGNGSTDLWRVS